MQVFPDYYKDFHCIAGACQHNCCIGWEIDIDPDSLARYESIPGAMGEKLRQNIRVEDGQAQFILGEDERCPFLNRDGLCELILFGGEGMLCDICTDHPRWRNFLPDRTETGLGLCCEAAAKLILTRREPVMLVCVGDETEESEGAELLRVRDEGLRILTDRSRPLEERETVLLSLCGAAFPPASPESCHAILVGMERLDGSWDEMLGGLLTLTEDSMAAFRMAMHDREAEYEQLAVYFFLRHYLTAWEEGDAPARAALAVFCTEALRRLGAGIYARRGAFSIEDQIELCRAFSAEIEYSDENIRTLLDMLA